MVGVVQEVDAVRVAVSRPVAAASRPVAAPSSPAAAPSSFAAAPSRPATIYDVARRAGVSAATVSRVMRNTAPVAANTRQRVQSAMSELRFLPNRRGVSLAEGRHAANGIVFPDLAGPYFAEVVLGYEEVAGELDRSVIILSTHGRAAPRDKLMDLVARVDGLVVLGRAVSEDLVTEVVATGLPVVTLARPTIEGTDGVNADNSTSAAALGEHLAAHEYRKVVLLGDPNASPDVVARWAGIRSAIAAADSSVDVDEVPSYGFDVAAGRRAGEAVLTGSAAPDAVVCGNDEIAFGVLLAMRDTPHRKAPQVAVTGWDDVMAASWAGLTTVRQPMRELGALAARLLDGRIRNPKSVPRHELLPTELIVRTSCGHHPEENR